MNEARRSRISPGIMIAIGVVATLVFGVLGTFGWLSWVWSQTPESVRATVGNGKRATVIGLACVSVATFFVGFAMTIVALKQAFAAVEHDDPSEKARHLAEGISSAMNWTALGLVPLPVAVIVAFVAGTRLLRAREQTEGA